MIKSSTLAVIGAVSWFAVEPALAETVVSIVTKLDLNMCRHSEGTEPEDYGVWRCRGYSGITVYVATGDQRTYVSYGRNAKNELAASETLAAFNGEGDSIEWRSVRRAGGMPKPFATIMQMSTTIGGEDPPVRGAVLVVTKLGSGGVCHVGYVDAKANSDAKMLAQKIADEHARAFRCGKDKPRMMGIRGPGFSGPYRN